ncbi:MAG: GGDEF domain-containing protein [Pseudomonadota bacterium]
MDKVFEEPSLSPSRGRSGLRRSRHFRVYASLMLTLALLAVSVAWADDDLPPDADFAALRAHIERHEAAAEFGEMILAAVDLERRAESRADRVFALRSKGRAYALLSDFERALDAMNRAVELVESDMDALSFAEIYRDTAGLLGEMGRYQQSLALIERGLALLEADSESELRANLLVMKASMLGALGQLDDALETMEAAMALPLATRRQQTMRLNNYGMIQKWRGEHGPALETFVEVLEQARDLEQEQIIVYALLEVGDVNRLLGNLGQARIFLSEALERSIAADQPRWLVFAHSYLVELESAAGELDAETRQREALAQTQLRQQSLAAENQATVLQVTMELLEREKRIDRLSLEAELQALRLDRSRKLSWLAGVASALLLVALWLAVQQVRVRSAANRKLDLLANTDTLTGLANRRFLIARAKAELELGGAPASIGLILIDLDRFKRVNDQFGHEQGDAVLMEVARRISEVMRDKDVVARWGGEEFLALLTACDPSTVRRVAERISKVIVGQPIVHEGQSHSITATIGVALARSGESFESVLQRADKALYRGKEKGRNRIEMSDRGSATG